MTDLRSNGINSKRKREDLTKHINISSCKHTYIQIYIHNIHIPKGQTTDLGKYNKYTNLTKS